LILTGATASLRGSATSASFASGKFALRATGQSLAREFGPKGVHVAHAIIDGVIDIPRTHDWPVNGGAPDGKISADAVSTSSLEHKVWKLMSSRLPIHIGTYIPNRDHISLKSWMLGHTLRNSSLYSSVAKNLMAL
jgi:hypothetical protein